jgi:hypothetical protein
MTDIWICSHCRSINRLRDSRCYSCGQRQEEAAAASEHTPNVRLAEAVANRTVRGYDSSLPFAVAAGVLIIVVAALGLWLLVESLRGMDIVRDAFVRAALTNDIAALDPLLAEQQRLASPSSLRLLLLLLAVLAFGLWLSRVRLNIPALGGGTPGWGPWKAFLYPLIPIVNLVRVPAMVQDALYRLDPRGGGLGMVLLAWVGFVGSWIIGVIGGIAIGSAFAGTVLRAQSAQEFADAFGSLIDQTTILSIVTEVMTAAGAVVLVAVIARIEMRAAARDAEIRAQLEPITDALPPSTDAPPPVPGAAVIAAAAPQSFAAADPSPATAHAPGIPGSRPLTIPRPDAALGAPPSASPVDPGTSAPPPPPPPPPAR